MFKHIKKASMIKAVGSKEKIIREIFGQVNSSDEKISLAHMTSPQGWEEPGQKPEFEEYTYVLKGQLKVETKDETFFVNQGEGIFCPSEEWVRYSTPNDDGAEYIAVCIPAFTPDSVHRDE